MLRLVTAENWLRFVGGGAVKAGNGHVEQAQIDCELRAVMDQMIQDHAANAGDLGHSENLFAGGEQRPAFCEIGIAGTGECRARFASRFVERSEKLLAILNFRWRVAGAVDRSVIEAFGVECHGESRQGQPLL